MLTVHGASLHDTQTGFVQVSLQSFSIPSSPGNSSSTRSRFPEELTENRRYTCYTLHIFLAGEGRYSIDGTDFSIRKGTVLLISPYCFHNVSLQAGTTVFQIQFPAEICDTDLLASFFSIQPYRMIQVSQLNLEFFRVISDEMMLYLDDRGWNHSGSEGKVDAYTRNLFHSILGKLHILLGSEASSVRSTHIRQAILYIQNHFTENIRLEDVARIAGYSPNYFNSQFKSHTGVSFKQFLNDLRFSFARKLLLFTDIPISQVCSECGYRDISVFSAEFKQKYGLSPKHFREQKRLTEISETLHPITHNRQEAEFMRIYMKETGLHTFRLQCGSHPAHKHAGEIFRKYIGTCTEPCSQRVYIGLTSEYPSVPGTDTLRGDGIRLYYDGDLYLLGNSNRGVLYAVYEFLERYCGMRFLTEKYEVCILDQPVMIEAVDYTFSPPFLYRNLLCQGTYEHEFRLKQHTNAQFEGFLPEDMGYSVAYAGQNCHTLGEYIPAGEFFADHPEYFAMNEQGERVPDTQPCLTNPDVLRITVERACKKIEEYPEATFVSISENDSHGHCMCPACRALDEKYQTDGGSLFWFVNEAAKQIGEKYPHILVDTLPYNYSAKPPVGMHMEPNVSVRFACMTFCREHSITDTSCKYNVEQSAYLAEWCKCASHVFLWDYTANFWNYLAVLPNLKLLYQNVHFYRRFPIDGIMYQDNHNSKENGAFGELWAYIEGKLLWNPDMDYTEYMGHIHEFLNLYYGNAGRDMFDYILLQFMQPSSDYHYGPAASCENIIPFRMQHDGKPDMLFIEDGNRLFDRAESLVSGEELFRVQKSRLQHTWYELATTYEYILENGTDAEKALLDQKYRRFFEDLPKYNIDRIYEGRPVTGEYDFHIHPYRYSEITKDNLYFKRPDAE